MDSENHIEILKQGVAVWNQWRNDYPAVIPNLRGIDCSYQALRGVNLGSAQLERASFYGTDLTGANLAFSTCWVAAFVKATLIEANIQDANLSFAQLTGANLQGAKLWGANFFGAGLTDANFAGAHLTQTSFNDVDLSDVRGLAEVHHGGPSSIGIETLFKSGGKIPDVFLRGCGVPQKVIQKVPSWTGSLPPDEFYSCFISHSHEDKDFADSVYKRLQDRKINCWLDKHQMLPGDDLHAGIDRGIRDWDKVLLCCSKASLKKSWWCDGEVNRAFQKEEKLMKERGRKTLVLMPLNLDGFLFSDEYQSGKRAEITSRVAANFVGWKNDPALFERELERVIRALRADDGGREWPPTPKL